MNSVAIVTGASQEIGRSTAIRLARDFSSIVLAARNANALKEVANTVKSAWAVPQIDLFEMTDEQWRTGMELKLHGARRVTVCAWKALKEAKGSVVFMSGSAALDPKPGFAAVAATNVAITALAKAFAEQGIKDEVQVNSIVPGAVMTGRRRSFLEKWHRLTT